VVSLRKFDSFLSKSWPDRIRAVIATCRHLLVKAHIVAPMGRRQFRRVVAQDSATLSFFNKSLNIIEQRNHIRALLSDERHRNPLRLTSYGFKVYSQGDEDGIIQEIFNRIGLESRIFVEFGVGDGLENNTAKLLLDGWRGLWLEGSPTDSAKIRRTFSRELASGQLKFTQAFIDRDNINSLISAHYTGAIDLISIDIDGNDIHILENLDAVSPRVLIIEYNGKFPPPMSIAQKYNRSNIWRGTDYNGSSLEAITKIAIQKGYRLVGCNIIGTNAFFVRADLVQDKFLEPFTAENHYEPARYFLLPGFVVGHSPDWGEYDRI